jgi:hypothetical protein
MSMESASSSSVDYDPQMRGQLSDPSDPRVPAACSPSGARRTTEDASPRGGAPAAKTSPHHATQFLFVKHPTQSQPQAGFPQPPTGVHPYSRSCSRRHPSRAVCNASLYHAGGLHEFLMTAVGSARIERPNWSAPRVEDHDDPGQRARRTQAGLELRD